MKSLLPKVCLVLLVALTGFGLVSAQDSNEAQSVDAQIYVSKVVLDKTSYNVGDVAKVTAEFYNGSSFAVGSFTYAALLGSNFDEAGNPGVIIEQVSGGKLSIAGKERKAISFDYKIPKNASGDNVKLQVTAMLPSGLSLGSHESDKVRITGGIEMIQTLDAYMQVYEKGRLAYKEHYPVGAGVPIDKDNRPDAELSVELQNNTSNDLVLTPTVSVFKRTVLEGDKIAEMVLKDVSLPKKMKKSTLLQTDVPHLDYAPGTYEGLLELKDKNGVIRSEPVTFRYVIRGEMAIIHSVVSDSNTVSAGQKYNVVVSVTGEPEDTFFENKETSHKATVEVVSKNQEGNLVASSSESVQLGSYMSTVSVPLISFVEAKTQIVSVTVRSEEGDILATYEEQLGDPSLVNNNLNRPTADQLIDSVGGYKTVIIIAAVILLIIGLGIFFSSKSFMAVLVLILLGGVFSATTVQSFTQDLGKVESKNYGWTGDPRYVINIFFDQPVDAAAYAPGADLVVRGHAQYVTCLNSDYYTYVQMGDGVIAMTPKAYLGVAYGSGSKSSTWRDRNFSHTFKAPTTIGNYVAKIKFYSLQRWYNSRRNPDQSPHDVTFSRVAYQPYVVQTPDCSTTNTCVKTDTGTKTTTDAGPSQCGSLTGSTISDGTGLKTTTADLCGTGNTLQNTQIQVYQNSGVWIWSCKDSDSSAVGCTAKCASGTNYCESSQTCSSTCDDWCPDSISGNPAGNQTLRNDFIIDADGRCIGAKVIKQFKLGGPFADRQNKCAAFWTIDSKIGTTTCMINDKPVSCIGTTGFGVSPGQSVLKAMVTADTNHDGKVDYTATDSASVKCVKNPQFTEQ